MIVTEKSIIVKKIIEASPYHKFLYYNKPESNDTGKDKANGFTTAYETEIYTNSEAGKNGVYFIIDGNGNVKETTKKEFKKIIEG